MDNVRLHPKIQPLTGRSPADLERYVVRQAQLRAGTDEPPLDVFRARRITMPEVKAIGPDVMYPASSETPLVIDAVHIDFAPGVLPPHTHMVSPYGYHYILFMFEEASGQIRYESSGPFLGEEMPYSRALAAPEQAAAAERQYLLTLTPTIVRGPPTVGTAVPYPDLHFVRRLLRILSR